MERHIYLLGGLFALTVLGAIFLPQLAQFSDNGLAAGATAALIFFALFIIAVLVAIILFVRSWPMRDQLPLAAQAIGLGALPLIVAVGVLFWIIVRIRG